MNQRTTPIVPTVGRVVLFFATPGGPEHAALVTRVHSNETIDLTYFPPGASPVPMTSVHLFQDLVGQERPIGAHAAWMEYQKGQAAKAEALEAELAAATSGQ